MENGLEIPKKLGINPPYDPATPLLGICPEKIIIQKDTCTPVFTVALFTMARTWKQPRHPLTDEWIKKLNIYTMEYYSVIKRNEFESVELRWMSLETEWNKSEREKQISHMSTYIWNLEKNGTDWPIYKAGIETGTQKLDLWARCGGKQRVGWVEREALKYIHYHVWNRWLMGSCCITQEAQPGALWWPRGVGWEGGMEAQDRGVICTLMASSHCCTAETDTTQ